MGNRVSITFKNNEDESVVFFSHWSGMRLVESAKKYLKELKEELKAKQNPILNPLDRLEPNTVMVDFIRWETKDLKRVDSDFYLGATEGDGDNGDNGHHIINLNE